MDWMDVRAIGDSEPTKQPAPEPAAPTLEPIPGLLDGLNPPQRAACEHSIGPLLILAGPGSGKTRVITTRIVHLLTEGGARPAEVLAITFTNKAAKEMRDRVQRTLPGADKLKGLWISTFHSMCARILRRDITALGYSRDFSIYDTSDRNTLLKQVIRSSNFDITKFRPPMVGGWISERKNSVHKQSEPDGGFSFVPDEDPEQGFDDQVLQQIHGRYEECMRSANALDFDDLLLKTLQLFDEHPGIRDSYSKRFRFVMVDEYQDTNRVQYLLTRHLASGHGNLAVCGDPDQSIYAWRGADIRNILAFEEDFGKPEVVKLEQNYRSKGNVLKAASAVIANNSARKAKDLWTDGEDGERVVVTECSDENEEGREIARQIEAHRRNGGSYSDVAIFYRVNFMQRALESALRLAKVPYQIVGGVEFYARREIRDLISYLKLAVNPADDVAFRRVVNVPSRGVGATSLERLGQFAAERRIPLLEACRSDEAIASIRGRGKKGLVEFRELVDRLIPLREVDSAVAFDFLLEELDQDRWFGEMDDGNGVADRIENVDELKAHAAEFDKLNPGGKVRGFLQDIALVSEVDGMEDDGQKVCLMTLHAAKGLEFPVVFLAGVEEELLPHIRSIDDGDEAGIEEERRLFYVGMTRAQDRLFLSHATTRRFFGEDRWTRPSRFMEEIPPELIEGGAPEQEEAEVLGEYDGGSEGDKLAVGDLVQHGHFGMGRIENLQGTGVNARATVTFVHHGTKQLLLQYAALVKVGAN